MKVVHDIKNPLLAALTLIEESDLKKEDKEEVGNELNDMRELLEQLKTEFKCKNNMRFKEKKEWRYTSKMVKSFMATNSKLAKNSNNALEFSVAISFPEQIYISATMLKRITNNLISNALKHTVDGKVKVSITAQK